MSQNITLNELNPEFAALAAAPNSLTSTAARRAGVSVDTFVNWRWLMSHQVRTAADAEAYLPLTPSERDGFTHLAAHFQAGISPYYMALMNQDPSVHCPIRLQVLPRAEEANDPLGLKDPLAEIGQSPVPEVVHMYPDRVAFCVAQLCPVYCRYCFRKRRDEEDGLHYNRRIIESGLNYIASNSAIKDVLITGGDPFIASDTAIEGLLASLRAIPHVEVIRFGTRTPVTLPYRVTSALTKMLAQYHPIWVNTHFNNPAELTPEANLAIANLVNAGIPVGNQSVLLRGINDDLTTMKELLRGLVRMRVRPYYLFHPHRIAGTDHLRVPLSTGIDIMRGLRGNLSGFAIPTYVVDTKSGKIPVTPNYMLGRDGDDIIFENNRGEIWREPGLV